MFHYLIERGNELQPKHDLHFWLKDSKSIKEEEFFS